MSKSGYKQKYKCKKCLDIIEIDISTGTLAEDYFNDRKCRCCGEVNKYVSFM